MNSYEVPIGIAIVVGVVVTFGLTIVLVKQARERARTEALRQVAESLGFVFTPRPDDMAVMSGGLDLFHKGREHVVRNLMSGVGPAAGTHVFDEQYKTGHGKRRKTWKQTVVAFELDHGRLPRFALQPKGFWKKVGAWLGRRSIVLEAFPDFSQTYVLNGESEPAIRQLFEGALAQQLERDDPLCLEGNGRWLIAYRSDRRVEPAQLSAQLARAQALHALVRDAGRRLV
jgi:hypothetical protein